MKTWETIKRLLPEGRAAKWKRRAKEVVAANLKLQDDLAQCALHRSEAVDLIRTLSQAETILESSLKAAKAEMEILRKELKNTQWVLRKEQGMMD